MSENFSRMNKMIVDLIYHFSESAGRPWGSLPAGRALGSAAAERVRLRIGDRQPTLLLARRLADELYFMLP